jgi:lysozyme family protein
MQALNAGQTAAAASAMAARAPLVEQAKALRTHAAWSDLRKGVILGAIGLALTFFSMLDDGTPNSVGLVFLFLGIGYAVLWYFEDRQLAAPASTPPPPPAGGA